MKNKLLLALILFVFNFCPAQPICEIPMNVTVSNVTNFSVSATWTSAPAEPFLWEVYFGDLESAPPRPESNGYFASQYNLINVNPLMCGTSYNLYVRKICSSGEASEWSAPIPFVTGGCQIDPIPDIYACPTEGTACFDLTQNDHYMPSNQITYYTNFADAHYNNLSNRIVNVDSYCIQGSNQPIFARMQEIPIVYSFFVVANQQQCSGITLDAFFDANNNGLHDIGENTFPLGQYHYEMNNDGNIHHITATSGMYHLYDSNISNNYTIGFTIDPEFSANYHIGIPQIQNINPAVGMVTYGFPITAVQPINDVSVTLSTIGQPQPGFYHNYILTYSNSGNQNIPSGIINFIKDEALTDVFLYEPADATATGFNYTFTNLAPFEKRNLYVRTTVKTIPDVNLGQLINSTVTIAPIANEVQLADNTATLTEIIVGSYDPNDKIEAHGEKIVTSEFSANDYLTYTIRFENTGTANAQKVRITDLLDDQLDATSVKMLSASHNYTLDRVNNSLTWKFANIYLPPVENDAQAAQGFVTFKVKLKPGFTTGTVIPNKAEIFFDFNPAIVTNTFETKFVDLLNVSSNESKNFQMYPNPASDQITISLSSEAIKNVKLYDVSGKKLKEENFESRTVQMPLNDISSGLYFLEITSDSRQKSSKKLIVK